MADLAQVLGQPIESARILAHLRRANAVVWLRGPSGAGKSEIAHEVVMQWKRNANEEIYLAGDKDQRDTPLFPLYRALKGWKYSKAFRRVLRQEGAAPLRDIPAIGNTLAFIMQLLRAGASHAPEYLSEDESEILSDLQSYSTEDPFLMVIDNIHWLDDATCRLIYRLLDEDIRESFSFARRLRLLCVETEDQAPMVNMAVLARLRERAGLFVSLQLPSLEAFPGILKAMGLKRDIARQGLEQLYIVSRGHLTIAQQIVRIGNDDGIQSMALTSTGTLPEIVMKLLEARMRVAEISGGKVERLLRIAACIGQSFSCEELKCAFSDPEGFTAALEVATREEYLRGGVELVFAHEVIQAALVTKGDSPAYHAKLLECFKTLRPADYASRFRHALLAGDVFTAGQLAFAVRAQRLRGDHLSGAPDFEGKIDDVLLPYGPEIAAYMQAIKQMDSGKHQEAIHSLAGFSAREDIIGAEIKYLLALNYFKLRTLPAYKVADSLLASALAEIDELELWSRLSSTHSVVLAHLGRMTEADRSRNTVIARLKKNNDSWAKTQRMILHRTASLVMPPEPACGEVSAAVEYFAPSKGTDMPRQAFQYMAALVNYSGVLFDLGRYGSSADAAATALEFHAKTRGVTRTVERYKVCNNLAIACLRSKRLSAIETADFMRLTMEGETPTHDRLLFLNNLAVVEALAGNIAAARERLEIAFLQVSTGNVDSFYYYVVVGNLAGLLHLSGHTRKGLALWRSLSDHLKRLPEYDFEVLAFRQTAFEKAFKQVRVGDAAAWDSYLDQEAPQFGDSWFFYRYGFLLSDIVVWSES